MTKTNIPLYIIIARMLQHPENVVKRIIEENALHKTLGCNRIAQKVSKELAYELEGEDVKEIIKKSKEIVAEAVSELAELNNSVEDNKRYEFIDDHYIVYKNVNTKDGKVKERYKLPVELIDHIFNDYSRHGSNMSGLAIQQKYKIKPAVWNLIKTNIGLYKDSNILSPMSMDNAERNGKIDDIIMDATYENFQDKYKEKYKEAHIATVEKEYKKLAKERGTLEGFLATITPMLDSIKPLHIQGGKRKGKGGLYTTVYHFGDTHLGKIGTKQVVERLDILANDIIKNPAKRVYVNCLGDIFETLVQGGMHSGQIEGMDGIYGTDLFMYGVNVYVDFLRKILESGKEVNFVGIGGNHDRGTILNKDDNERMYATIFYELLKAYLANAKIKFQIIREKIGSFEVDGIQYLVGHEGVGSKQPEKIAWKFADTGKQVVYVTAHIHNEQIYTGKNVTQLIINALAGENDYDKRMGMHSYPGYAKTIRNEFGLPDIESRRLP